MVQRDPVWLLSVAAWSRVVGATHTKSVGDATLVILGTVWDTGNDATQFNDAMRTSLGSLKKDGALWTDGKRFFSLKHAASSVTFVGGTNRAAVQRAIDAK